MKRLNYNLDELDLDLLLDVTEELKKTYGSEANNLILESSFVKRLAEDPVYVHHYDEVYWAEVIKKELQRNTSILV